MSLPTAVFLLTYLGMALGGVPGLRLDRSGIALLAVVALLASGDVAVARVGAAIDGPTLLLLFALMIVSAQFQAAGLYRWAADRVAGAAGSGRRLLVLTVAVAGVLSAVLANDIVVFAMTPIVAAGIRARGLDPRPHLLGLAAGANAGSAMTLIGNPQNILIGQVGQLDFWRFLLACAGPGAMALAVAVLALAWVWRRELAVVAAPVVAPVVPPQRWHSLKALLAVAALLVLFATPLPREVGALVIAGVLLLSRRLASRDMIGAVDWHLLLLFACLFVVTDAFAATGVAARGVEALAAAGWLPERLAVMVPLAVAASNTIGNVPATMLILAMWPSLPEGALYGLAVLSTLAGNLLLVGSLANIIVAERAAAVGIRLSFADFARAGVPMTVVSMALAALWLAAAGAMAW
ncbi:MAG: anion transporter [Magnetospirillum sp.]|nr:anion transporter [Magnetospirillum sp.]